MGYLKQLIYTSCQYGINTTQVGFQFYSKTESISYQDMEYFKDKGLYDIPQDILSIAHVTEQAKKAPVKYVYAPEQEQTYLVRANLVDQDYSRNNNRSGNYLSHYLILSKQAFDQSIHSIDLFNSPFWKRELNEKERNHQPSLLQDESEESFMQQIRDDFSFKNLHQFLKRKSLNQATFINTLATLSYYLYHEKNINISIATQLDSHQEAVQLLALVLKIIHPSYSQHINYSTLEKNIKYKLNIVIDTSTNISPNYRYFYFDFHQFVERKAMQNSAGSEAQKHINFYQNMYDILANDFSLFCEIEKTISNMFTHKVKLLEHLNHLSSMVSLLMVRQKTSINYQTHHLSHIIKEMMIIIDYATPEIKSKISLVMRDIIQSHANAELMDIYQSFNLRSCESQEDAITKIDDWYENIFLKKIHENFPNQLTIADMFKIFGKHRHFENYTINNIKKEILQQLDQVQARTLTDLCQGLVKYEDHFDFYFDALKQIYQNSHHISDQSQEFILYECFWDKVTSKLCQDQISYHSEQVSLLLRNFKGVMINTLETQDKLNKLDVQKVDLIFNLISSSNHIDYAIKEFDDQGMVILFQLIQSKAGVNLDNGEKYQSIFHQLFDANIHRSLSPTTLLKFSDAKLFDYKNSQYTIEKYLSTDRIDKFIESLFESSTNNAAFYQCYNQLAHYIHNKYKHQNLNQQSNGVLDHIIRLNLKKETDKETEREREREKDKEINGFLEFFSERDYDTSKIVRIYLKNQKKSHAQSVHMLFNLPFQKRNSSTNKRNNADDQKSMKTVIKMNDFNFNEVTAHYFIEAFREVDLYEKSQLLLKYSIKNIVFLDKTIEILFDELTFSDQLTLFYFFYKQSDSKSKRVKEILLTSIIFNLLIFVTILFVVLCFWYIFIKRGA